MFFRRNEITLNRVHDRIRVREGRDVLELVVDGDPMRIVAGLNHAQKLLQRIDEETTEEDKQTAASYFAEVIFGEKQAKQLMEFYRDDALCVINVCGGYFQNRLGKLITKAQKK